MFAYSCICKLPVLTDLFKKQAKYPVTLCAGRFLHRFDLYLKEVALKESD